MLAGLGGLLAGLLATAAPLTGTALAQPATQPTDQPTQSAPRPAGQPGTTTPSWLRLDIDRLDPRVVTSTSGPLTVTGTVTNIGDRRIDGIKVRLQRGEPADGERAVREGLAETAATDSARTQFREVAAALQPGQSIGLSLQVAVSGGVDSLRVDKPGVYPVLVNVNGQPEYGGETRLVASTLLLPVLGVPGGETAPPGAAAPSGQPPSVTVVWPITDLRPRRPQAQDGTTVLADDDLAESLREGGRLAGLVADAAEATSADPALAGAVCFAVDPDLVQTVEAMTRGYRVRTGSGDVDGSGQQAARSWLDALRRVTRDRCVFALPYADADLVALSRAGATDLLRLSLTGTSIVQNALKPVNALSGLVWPADGTMDQRTTGDIAAGGAVSVLADPSRLQQAQGTAPYTLGPADSTGAPVAVPYDGLTAAALTGGQREHPTVATQNGMAAVVFRAAFDPDAASSGVLVVPPRRWLAPRGEPGALLGLVSDLLADGHLAARPLADVVGRAPGGSAGGMDYSPSEVAAEVPATVTREAVRVYDMQRDLRSWMVDDSSAEVHPDTLVSPLQYGLLRATSTSWRSRGSDAVAAMSAVSGQLDQLRAKVHIVSQGRPLSLASSDSPIPVFLKNDLPVTITVRITFVDTPGLRPRPVTELVILGGHSRTEYVPAEVTRSGRFSVDVEVTTPGGTPLGVPQRLELNSTSYGKITLAVTGAAFGVLVLLVFLRLYRRVRARRPAAADTSDAFSDD